jgi:hypothetical protein
MAVQRCRRVAVDRDGHRAVARTWEAGYTARRRSRQLFPCPSIRARVAPGGDGTPTTLLHLSRLTDGSSGGRRGRRRCVGRIRARPRRARPFARGARQQLRGASARPMSNGRLGARWSCGGSVVTCATGMSSQADDGDVVSERGAGRPQCAERPVGHEGREASNSVVELPLLHHSRRMRPRSPEYPGDVADGARRRPAGPRPPARGPVAVQPVGPPAIMSCGAGEWSRSGAAGVRAGGASARLAPELGLDVDVGDGVPRTERTDRCRPSGGRRGARASRAAVGRRAAIASRTPSTWPLVTEALDPLLARGGAGHHEHQLLAARPPTPDRHDLKPR